MRSRDQPPPGEACISGPSLLRLSAALAITALMTVQRVVGVHASVGVRLATGHVLSLMLCIMIAILGGIGGGG
jgi:hypothetical protein